MNQGSTGSKRESIIDLGWLLALIAVTSVWCYTAARSTSAVFDEPTYLQCGLKHWHTGSYKSLMKLGTMPLPVDVETLPLYLWEKTSHQTIDPDRDIAWILPWARTAALVFWWLLLVYVFRAAKALGGSWAGRIACTLIAFEPSLLGHAMLATTDIAVTACLMAFAYEFWAGRGRGWFRAIGIPSVLYGIAILAKASSLVFAPLFMLVIEFDRLCRTEDFLRIAGDCWQARLVFLRDGLWKFRRDFFRIIGLGLLVTFLYCGSDWTTEPTFVKWAKGSEPGDLHQPEPGLPPGHFRDTMLWIAEHLKIFTNAGEGLVQQIKHNIRGHGAFILGHAYKRAVWWYFPLALTIKSTITLLLLPLLVAALRPRALWNWACLGALALLLYSPTCHVQIGIRFMFPLMVLAAVGAAAGLMQILRATETRWKRIALVMLTSAGLAWSGRDALAAWPDGICYTNEFWGGTPNGYWLLSDTNYDWGQELPQLLDWRAKHGVDVMHVWYFGLDPRYDVLPLQQMEFHSIALKPGETLESITQGKCIAVSTTLLYGAYFMDQQNAQDAMAFFRQHKPAGRTTTYFIYDFRQPPSPSTSTPATISAPQPGGG